MMLNPARRPIARLTGGFLALFTLCLVLLGHAHAAESVANDESADTVVPSALSSPRATMETFLQAMNDIKRGQPGRIDDAISALDLSGVNPLVQRERGSELAWTLLEIMDRTRRVDTARVPNRAEGAPWTFERYPQGTISVARVSDGRWLFSRASLERLTEIMDGLQEKKRVVSTPDSAGYQPLSLRLRQAMPRELRRTAVLLEHWQWIAIALVIMLGVIADKIGGLILATLVRRWRSSERARFYGEIKDNLLRPFALFAMAAVWWAGLNLLSLPDNVLAILLTAAKFLVTLSGVWGAYRLVDVLSAWLREKASGTATKVDDVLVPLLTRTAKVLITVVGIVFLADTLRMNITGLLAGLGLGGLAFALAAKDVVENLFGSVTVVVDRPFTVGDWVIIDDVEGTVEDMGFRSTRIRTFYNSVVSMPNSRMITAHVDNMGKRRYRRFKTTLGVAYDTPPAKIAAFCEGIRELVRLHPDTRKDYFHVYFNDLGASSLDIMVYIFFQCPDWSAELQARHAFLLDVMKLADKLGVEFAFPTRTLYMRQEDTPCHQDWGELDSGDIGRMAAGDVSSH
ncbi:MAG: mechanosensitive ion channel family protein [Gammaproteobacteria bacterium]